MHPEVEWWVTFQLPDLPPDKTIYRGPDEIRQLWAAFRSAWESLVVTLEDVVEERGNTAVVRTRFVGQGTGGIEVDRTVFYVFEITDRKLRRPRPFDTADEALAAASA